MRLPDWERYAPWVVGLSSVTLLVAVWELAGLRDIALTTVMPPPSQFLSMVIESDFRIGLGSQSATLYEALMATFGRVFTGMFLAFIGVTGRARGLENINKPYGILMVLQ